jgi:hypothetical protein
VSPPESRGGDRPSGVPSPEPRTSPLEVSLPCGVFTEPGSGPLVARPPHALRRLGARAPGCFPVRLPESSEEFPGPPLGFGPPSGFPTGRSGRPVSGSAPPMEFFAPTTTTRPQVRFTRACRTRHLPASGLRPSRRFAPCGRCRSEDRRRPGVHPSGRYPCDQPHPLPGRYPRAVSGSPCLLL